MSLRSIKTSFDIVFNSAPLHKNTQQSVRQMSNEHAIPSNLCNKNSFDKCTDHKMSSNKLQRI